MFVRLADTGPVASAFWRMAIATPLIWLMATLAGQTRGLRISRPMIMIMGLSGVLFAADLASWHAGILQTKIANASLFGNSASLIFPVYGFAVSRVWPARRQFLALVMAAAGAALLMGRSAELSSDHLAGDVLSLLAGIFYAAYFIMISRARQTVAPLPVLAASTLASVAPLFLLALAMGETIMPAQWGPLIGLALFSQVIGQGLMIYALGHVRPLVIGLALLTQPVVSALTGWLLFSENLAAPDLTGAVLIGLAFVLVREPDRR